MIQLIRGFKDILPGEVELWQAVEKVAGMKKGASVDKFIFVPTMVLTKDILDKGTDPMLQYVK